MVAPIYMQHQGPDPGKTKIDKPDFIKIKNFCPVKNNLMRIRRKIIDWEKIFAKNMTDEGLLTKIHTHTHKTLKIYNKKTNNVIKKLGKDMNSHFIKEDTDGK